MLGKWITATVGAKSLHRVCGYEKAGPAFALPYVLHGALPELQRSDCVCDPGPEAAVVDIQSCDLDPGQEAVPPLLPLLGSCYFIRG